MFYALLKNGVCKSIDEIKYHLTIDQVRLFYQKAVEKEMDDNRTSAIIMAQAINYASPPTMGTTKSDLSKKNRAWDKFMNSLTPNFLEKKKKIKSKDEAIKLFKNLGIPLRGKKDVKQNGT